MENANVQNVEKSEVCIIDTETFKRLMRRLDNRIKLF